MATTRGVIRLPTEREFLQILLTALDGEGDLGLVEMAMASGGSGPPLHIHPTHGEGCYLLAGELTVQIDDEIVTGGPGMWAFAPKNVPHTLANFGADEARLLCMFAPAGFERRFERMIATQNGVESAPEPSAAERETRAVGPPLSSAAPQPGGRR